MNIFDRLIAAAKREIVRAIMRRVKLPGLIQIQRDPRRQLNEAEKHEVYSRDGAKCRYCGQSVNRLNAHFDHVYPWSKGGETSVANIVTSCQGCNLSKGDSVGKMWPNKLR